MGISYRQKLIIFLQDIKAYIVKSFSTKIEFYLGFCYFYANFQHEHAYQTIDFLTVSSITKAIRVTFRSALKVVTRLTNFVLSKEFLTQLLKTRKMSCNCPKISMLAE